MTRPKRRGLIDEEQERSETSSGVALCWGNDTEGTNGAGSDVGVVDAGGMTASEDVTGADVANGVALVVSIEFATPAGTITEDASGATNADGCALIDGAVGIG